MRLEGGREKTTVGLGGFKRKPNRERGEICKQRSLRFWGCTRRVLRCWGISTSLRESCLSVG